MRIFNANVFEEDGRCPTASVNVFTAEKIHRYSGEPPSPRENREISAEHCTPPLRWFLCDVSIIHVPPLKVLRRFAEGALQFFQFLPARFRHDESANIGTTFRVPARVAFAAEPPCSFSGWIEQ